MSKLRNLRKNLNQVKVARATEKVESDKKNGLTPFSNRRSQRPKATTDTKPNILEVTVDKSVVTNVKYSKE